MNIGKNIGNFIPVGPSNMEPLMPSLDRELFSLSAGIAERIGELKGKLNPITAKEVASILAEMNSYYSNLIEGQPTYPKDIERALNNDFSSNPTEREKQLLGAAHFKTEKLILENVTPEIVFTPDFILSIHKTFYGFLPKQMHIAKTKSGDEYPIVAGALRDFEVEVGGHQPPKSDTLNAFLNRFCSFYKSISRGEVLIASAAAHHRLAWIHPFGDGNGRVTRLFSTALLRAFDFDAQGIWSMSRGLARRKSDYYKFLAKADADRQNDLDGRGTLSNKGLCEFCRFYLEVMSDQMDFMLGVLRLDKILERYEMLLHNTFPKKSELYARIIKEIWISGEIPRGKASEITGMSERTSRSILSELEAKKFIKSSSPKTPVRINITSDISEEIFPNLYIH